MSLTGVLLGLINIAIVVALFILVGCVIVWLLQVLAGVAVPQNVQKIYMLIVALIAIYMLVALLLGLGVPFRVLGHGAHASIPWPYA